MKRWLFIAFAALCLIACASNHDLGKKTDDSQVILPPEPDLMCKSAVLMDYDTGTVLYAKDSLAAVAPASMAKLMTTYLLAEKIKEGEYSLDDMITVPKEADFRNAPPHSSLAFLTAGNRITLRHLLEGLLVCSGNDAATAAAILVAGSSAGCVDAMNKKALELGFTSFKFVDPAGYYGGNSVNALEFCQFCRLYIKDCYDIMEPMINAPSFTSGGITQSNSNDLLGRVIGVDGMKTGHIDECGYNLALTACRGGMRLVAVIMGLDGKNVTDGRMLRIADGTALLTYGFSAYRTLDVELPEGFSVPVAGCKVSSVPASLSGPAKICVPYSVLRDLRMDIELERRGKVAVRQGDVLGKCTVRTGSGEAIESYSVVASSDAERASFLRRLISSSTKGQKFSIPFQCRCCK